MFAMATAGNNQTREIFQVDSQGIAVSKGAVKEFAFVEVAKTGRVTDKNHLRIIRKHVMKDIGKARRKKTTAPEGSKADPLAIIALSSGEKGAREFQAGRHLEQPIIPTGLVGSGRMDPFSPYPVPLDMETLFLIDHVYTWPDVHLRPFRDIWLPISMADAAFFTEILSHIALHVYTLRQGFTRASECPQSIVLHTQAIKSVIARLMDPILGTSEGVVGTILAFACFSHRTNDWAEYDMHIDALQKIINRRGGVDSLIHNQELRQLISGVDMAATCVLRKTKTTFPLPSILKSSKYCTAKMPWPIPPAVYQEESIWKHSFSAESVLFPVFHDLTTFIMELKCEARRNSCLNTQVTLANRPTIFALMDRFDKISTSIEDITTDNLIEECCRIGAILLLTGICNHFPSSEDIERPLDIQSLIRKLHIILIKLSYNRYWTLGKQLMLWATALGAIFTINKEEQNDFLDIMASIGGELRLHNWMEVLLTVSNLLWVGEVLDEKFSNIVLLKGWWQ
ncbi:hypothetical protein F5884DRAFT_550814 [Xylogone sp. PMI_703]|nr:hypothetical protein F5884DRAFT_550814 [Xylogone sp. PMI_703]